jgi:hypothetical protein
MFKKSGLIGVLCLMFLNLINAQEIDRVDWAKFLSRHDLSGRGLRPIGSPERLLETVSWCHDIPGK